MGLALRLGMGLVLSFLIFQSALIQKYFLRATVMRKQLGTTNVHVSPNHNPNLKTNPNCNPNPQYYPNLSVNPKPYKMKKVLRETQTLRDGCSKVEPKIFARADSLSGGAGPPKFNQLEMVITCTYRPSLVKIDALNFELSW